MIPQVLPNFLFTYESFNNSISKLNLLKLFQFELGEILETQQ